MRHLASPAARRLETALDLYQAGEDLLRSKLGRDRPGIDEREIQQLVNEWLARPLSHLEGDAHAHFRLRTNRK